MKKKIISLVMIAFIAVFIGASFSFVTVQAKSSTTTKNSISSAEQTSTVEEEPAEEYKIPEDSYLLDQSDIVLKKQEANLNKDAAKIYENYGVKVFMLGSDSVFGNDADNIANKFYKANADTDAALVLLVDSEECYVYTFDRAEKIFSNEEIEQIVNDAEPKKSGYYTFFSLLNSIDLRLKEKGVQPIPEERLLPRLVDNADLLTDSEESNLTSKLDEISERQQMDVVIVTINSLEGKTATAYADDFYDYNGYGFNDTRDGILLLVAMDDREWAISTCGSGIPTFTDAGQEYIVEQFKPDLSDGYYFDAFITFADLCDDYITQADADEPYDYGNMPKGAFPLVRNLLIALLIGVIIAVVVVCCMASQLKSVGMKRNASDYTVPNSLRLTQNQDLFLYHVVTKRVRPKDDDSSSGGGSSSHTSSSGSSHGGSSGSF